MPEGEGGEPQRPGHVEPSIETDGPARGAAQLAANSPHVVCVERADGLYGVCRQIGALAAATHACPSRRLDTHDPPHVPSEPQGEKQPDRNEQPSRHALVGDPLCGHVALHDVCNEHARVENDKGR